MLLKLQVSAHIGIGRYCAEPLTCHSPRCSQGLVSVLSLLVQVHTGDGFQFGSLVAVSTSKSPQLHLASFFIFIFIYFFFRQHSTRLGHDRHRSGKRRVPALLALLTIALHPSSRRQTPYSRSSLVRLI